jgi:hypothetical protein
MLVSRGLESERLNLLQGVLAKLLMELDIDKSVVKIKDEKVEEPRWVQPDRYPTPHPVPLDVEPEEVESRSGAVEVSHVCAVAGAGTFSLDLPAVRAGRDEDRGRRLHATGKTVDDLLALATDELRGVAQGQDHEGQVDAPPPRVSVPPRTRDQVEGGSTPSGWAITISCLCGPFWRP